MVFFTSPPPPTHTHTTPPNMGRVLELNINLYNNTYMNLSQLFSGVKCSDWLTPSDGLKDRVRAWPVVRVLFLNMKEIMDSP